MWHFFKTNGCAYKMEPSEISYKSDCLLIIDAAAGIGVDARDGESQSECCLFAWYDH